VTFVNTRKAKQRKAGQPKSDVRALHVAQLL
jgi:hypothetical protein